MFESSKNNETVFLDRLIEEIESRVDLTVRAEKTIGFWKKQEPLFAKLLITPQSPPYHAEGPTLEAHISLMLKCLYAFSSGEFSLLDVEEFAREKGYDGILTDITKLFREEESFFETFILCHDIAKSALVWFDAPPGSVGHDSGFAEKMSGHATDLNLAQRNDALNRYNNLFQNFINEHSTDSSEQLAVDFYQAYAIQVHYYGHEKGIYLPVFSEFLGRVSDHKKLTHLELERMEILIAHHLDPLKDFQFLKSDAVKKYVSLAETNHWQTQDLLRRFQAVLLLDAVCGSKQLAPHGVWHDSNVFVHFLRSEHAFTPAWRTAREDARKQEQAKLFRRLFREVGLDGVSLMEFFNIGPSPEFGKLLRSIQEAVVLGKDIPKIHKDFDRELQKRSEAFYKKRFSV